MAKLTYNNLPEFEIHEVITGSEETIYCKFPKAYLACLYDVFLMYSDDFYDCLDEEDQKQFDDCQMGGNLGKYEIDFEEVRQNNWGIFRTVKARNALKIYQFPIEYIEGTIAYRNGLGYEVNPYARLDNKEKCNDWRSGFDRELQGFYVDSIRNRDLNEKKKPSSIPVATPIESDTDRALIRRKQIAEKIRGYLEEYETGEMHTFDFVTNINATICGDEIDFQTD